MDKGAKRKNIKLNRRVSDKLCGSDGWCGGGA